MPSFSARYDHVLRRLDGDGELPEYPVHPHNPAEEPETCATAVLHELAGAKLDDRAETLAHGLAAVSALARQVEAAHGRPAVVAELRRELSEARAMAWGYEHRRFDGAGVPAAWAAMSPDGEWRLPEWLATSVEPQHQPWWVPPDEETGDEAGERPTDVVVTAGGESMREQFGHLWRLEDTEVPDVVAGHAERWRTLASSAREFGADGLTDVAATELALAVALLLRDRAQRLPPGGKADTGAGET